MSDKLLIVEFDNDEAKSIIKVFGSARLERFLPEVVGEEPAHEAMDAMRNICREVRELIPPEGIDTEDFYSVSAEITNSQVDALLKFSNRLAIEDVNSWGYSIIISKEVICAMWCIKDGLMRAISNIDQPLRSPYLDESEGDGDED